MKPPRNLKTAAILAGMFFMAACASLPFVGGQAPTPSPFIDIRVPPELTVDEKATRVEESAAGRLGVLTASGRIKAVAVTSFYGESMAQDGWTQVGRFEEEGGKVMTVYNKGRRSAAVTVTDGWVSTEVNINVTAK